MRRRRSSVAAAFACVTSLAIAGGAAATPMTVQVVNGRGVEQVSRVTDSSGSRWTNGHGLVVLDVAPGEQVAATRGDAAPEGAAGVTYSAPDPVPALARITLPALPDALAPAHDAAEAWLLAAVNGERAGRGLASLQQSGSLNRAADVYARYLFVNDVFSHTALFTPPVRAVDQGWPIPGGGGLGEVLALAPSKESALAGLEGKLGPLDSPDERRRQRHRCGAGRQSLGHDSEHVRPDRRAGALRDRPERRAFPGHAPIGNRGRSGPRRRQQARPDARAAAPHGPAPRGRRAPARGPGRAESFRASRSQAGPLAGTPQADPPDSHDRAPDAVVPGGSSSASRALRDGPTGA